ncbi:hypothetical protein HML84_21525 [Alcanivorax sp. IO_7]|nr:hypothetical protein HML84_21525 [Alcanivorax sp. IO_7]
MKRRDFLFKAGVAGTVGAAAAGVGFPAIAKGAVEWRMQSTWRRNSPLLSTGPDLVADYVNKASGGRMKLKVYTAGEVVGPLEVFDAVADGTLHMGHGYPAFWSGKHPGFQFLAPLPFGMTSQEQNAWFAYGGGQALIDQLYGEFGLKFFPSGNTSVQGIWLNKDINAAADFKGMKIRTGALAGSVLQAFGAVPVQLPLGKSPRPCRTAPSTAPTTWARSTIWRSVCRRWRATITGPAGWNPTACSTASSINPPGTSSIAT